MQSWLNVLSENGFESAEVPPTGSQPSGTSVVLVVTRNSNLALPVMDYTISVADRMNCKLLIVYVNTLPFLRSGGFRERRFVSAIDENASIFRTKAESRGIAFDYVMEAGKVSKVVHRICHIVKRIDFVVIDKGINGEAAASRAPVPVFAIEYGNALPGQMKLKRKRCGNVKKRSLKPKFFLRMNSVKALFSGLVTIGLYLAFFANADTVMNYSTRGGIFVVLPLATVCIFFFALLSFINNGSAALGLQNLVVSRQRQRNRRKNRQEPSRANVDNSNFYSH